jgi:hypothetical protein
MGVLGAITAVSGIVSAGSSIAGGIAEKNAAERNAQIYEAQAANIAAQEQNVQAKKNIVAGQYRNKQAALKGTAVTTAAHAGVKVSGSVAQSISQSITQLQIEQSYKQYNLDVERYNLQVQRQQALDEAAFQRKKGRQALLSGFMNAGTTALSSAGSYYSKYWNNGTNGNSFGTTIKHYGSSISNGFYNITHGITSQKSQWAMAGLPS